MADTKIIAMLLQGGVGKTSVVALMVKQPAGRNDRRILVIDADFNSSFIKQLSKMSEADWILAQMNDDKWMFERTGQISTGDTYCNSTY